MYKLCLTPTIINSVRIAAVQQILPHLISSDEAKTARPNLELPTISSLHNLYCLQRPANITLDTSKTSILKVKRRNTPACVGAHGWELT